MSGRAQPLPGSDAVRLPSAAVAALRAWADLDRFELPDVPLSQDDGWTAVGTLERDVQPDPWPPRPMRSPERQQKILDTRIMFGCLEVTELEELLDAMFSDDERFVQTGIRRPRRSTPGSAGKQQTYRGSFRVGQTGQLVPGSFGYAPLIDFARHVEHFTKNFTPVRSAIAQALAAIDDREARLRDSFDAIAQSGVVGYPAVSRVLSSVRVRNDRSRYVKQWIWPDDQPEGQLPAFFRGDLLHAAAHPTSPLLAEFLAGRPGERPPDHESRRATPSSWISCRTDQDIKSGNFRWGEGSSRFRPGQDQVLPVHHRGAVATLESLDQ